LAPTARRGNLAAVRSFLLFVAACGAWRHPPRPTVGAIAGIARDHDSGDAVAKADIVVRADGNLAPYRAVTTAGGGYVIDRLKPGRYSLSATFAGQPVDVERITVRAGDTAVVDIVFTLGHPDPVRYEFGDPRAGLIDHYHPPGLAPTASIIEGTVNDAGSHGRVGGAVVTVVGGTGVLQTVSDEQGRYRFERITPGTYAVSTYYSVSGHGQMEIRRSDIHVDGAEAVYVPLWIESAGQ
jgi:hypothetical protein